MRQEEYLNRFTQLQQFKIGLTQRKNADYAGVEDAFKNFQLIEYLTGGQVTTAAGILVRMTDKLQRIANLLARPAQVADEKIGDTCNDLSIYSDIMYLWLTRNEETLPLPGFTPPPPPEPVEPYIDEINPEGEKNFGDLAEKALKGLPLSPSERVFLEMATRMKLAALQGDMTQGAV